VHGKLHIFDGVEALNEAAARHWQEQAGAAVAARGAFHVALAGGSTPRRLYARLAQDDYRQRLPWAKTHIYFGDERCVPPDHADSNYRMAHEALLSQVPVPRAQIHPLYDPALSPEQNATHYAELIGGIASFDLILLGMGDDGHTASLFPGTAILDETRRLVAAQYVEKLAAWRISLTLPTLNAARQVSVLVAGVGKAERIAAVAGTNMPYYPIQRVQPQPGRLDWFLDHAAAQQLPAELQLEELRR
jgi:6-phosphogluconolactonase